MRIEARYLPPARAGPLRQLRLLAAAAMAAMASGCAGGGALPEPPMSFTALAGVPADHGLAPGDRIAVPSGGAEEHGNVIVHCPADAAACTIVVDAGGSVGYDPGGGVPAVGPRAPEPVRDALERRLAAATWPVAFGFGGAVATCQALGCPVAGAVHVDRPGAGGGHRPGEVHPRDLSGFERLAPRRGIGLARKARPASDGGRPAVHRAFGAWMEHGFFLVETFTGRGDEEFTYRTAWFGDAGDAGPVASPDGTARWSGVMSGVALSPSGGGAAFVHGDSAVTVSGLGAATGASVDVALTGIVNQETGAGIGDMAWRGLPLRGRAFGTDDVLFDDGAGYFRDGGFGAAADGSLYGRINGPGAGEAGGLFRRGAIAGAFAARRDR